MFEKFLSANSRDFRQRYEGTYGYYRGDDGKRLLVRLREIGDRECIFVDARGLEYRLMADSEKDIGFEFLPPKSNYYNTDTGAVLVTRAAARQFQRGISQINTIVQLLGNKGTWLGLKVGFDTLTKIYDNNISDKVALQSFLEKNSVSFALMGKFAFTDDNKVFVLDNVIGEWKLSDKWIIKLEDGATFGTELLDAFKVVDQPAEIV